MIQMKDLKKQLVRKSLRLAVPLLASLAVVSASANYTFTITDIRLQGLQRVSAGSVFDQISIDVGDVAEPIAMQEMIRGLFKLGYFDNIQVARDEDVLIIELTERPAIDSIKIDGNKAIKTEDLLEGLGSQGLAQGEIFKQATLDRVRLELERQYASQGQYTAEIETSIRQLPRNRVAIAIQIDEGKKSGIRQINFVGNKTYDKRTLLGVMELKQPKLLGFIRGQSQYSREKLQGDLESIQAYYRNRGYVEFQIESTQISMTPDRKQVYLSISMTEGDKFVVDEVSLIGELGDMNPDALRRLFLVESGEIFNSARVTATEERLTAALTSSGYTFGTASGVPEIKEGGSVDVKFVVNTGKRAYVRRLTFAGNKVTQDSVLRREMRQLEGARASTTLIDLSKARLERLGYFGDVNVETPAVVGTEDQIDVDITVSEQPTGSISGTLGYQKYSGLMLGANFQQTNIAGTGNSLGVGLNWSDYTKSFNFQYMNPYYTEEGISRGIGIYFTDTNYSSLRFTRFSTESIGGGMNFGFPVGETKRLQFSGRFELTDLTQGYNQAVEIADFVDSVGSKFLNFKVEGLWSNTTLNRAIFATSGSKQVFALELSVPGSDLEFLRATYRGEVYFPIRRNWAVKLRTSLAYGEAYGKTEVYPFYEHFYAGGFGSVRGFERSSLGPRSTPTASELLLYTRGRPFGGNILTEFSTELVFPLPFLDQLGQIRSVYFVDVGNVFNTNCPDNSVGCFKPTVEELRGSTGLGVSWLSRMGPMSISLAFPFNTQDYDEEEVFSFEVGQSF